MPASPLLVCPDSKMNTFAAIKPDVVLWHAVPDATWALVPVKAFAEAKQRLSSHLTPPRRIAFARAMMEKVIRQLQATPILAGVMKVVTGDEEVAAFARLLGTRVLIENRPVSLTSAVAYGTCSLFDEGADAVLVLPADLPFIHSQDLIALLACRDDAAVTIVPSRDGTGTNALLVTAACPELFAFGSIARRAIARGQRPPACRCRSEISGPSRLMSIRPKTCARQLPANWTRRYARRLKSISNQTHLFHDPRRVRQICFSIAGKSRNYRKPSV